MRIDLSINVDRPRDEVFAYLSDLNKVAEWADAPVLREKLSAGPVGVGTRIRAVDKVPGRRIEFIEEVTVYEPPERFALTMSSPVNGEVKAGFSAAAQGCRVDFAIELNPSGLLGVLAPIMRRPFTKMFEKDLANAKRILEGR